MSDLLLGLVGALIGLVLALFGNLVVLPLVLKRQKAWFERRGDVPFFGGDRAKTLKFTSLMYRVYMPILFSIIGATGMVTQFGSAQ